jgi:RES domain-containing protein
MPSPHRVDAIDRIDPVPYRGEAYRHLAPRWHPLSGGGARIQGGRWNPPESFATLYLALEKPTAAAEFRRMADQIGRSPEDFVPRRLYRYRLDLQAVLDLTGERDQLPQALAELDFQGSDQHATQALGEAAEHLGREAIKAPSATGTGEVIAVFIDRLLPDSAVEPLDFETWESPPPD